MRLLLLRISPSLPACCVLHTGFCEGMCPQGRAFVDTASGKNMAHTYAECSNRGSCDRKTGQCECFDGFTGAACRRTTCPNSCSGHGTCETIAELASDTSTAVGGKSYNSYGAWDQEMLRGCKCDARYSGIDCSTRMCPRGDDPLTKDVDVTQTETTSLQVPEVQNVTAQSVSALMNGGQVTFTHTDLYNGVWTTRPVDLPTVSTLANTYQKMAAVPFGWVPVVHDLIATFDATDKTTWGQAAVESAVEASPVVATVTVGTASPLIQGDLVVLNGYLRSATTTGFDNHGVYRIKGSTAATTTELMLRDGTTDLPAVAHGAITDHASTLTRVMGVTSIDATSSTDQTRTFRLDAALTTAQAASIRAGDQLLASNAAGTSTCLITVSTDTTASTTIVGTAAPRGYAAAQGTTDPDACRITSKHQLAQGVA